jgi:hypothetical protein
MAPAGPLKFGKYSENQDSTLRSMEISVDVLKSVDERV